MSVDARTTIGDCSTDFTTTVTTTSAKKKKNYKYAQRTQNWSADEKKVNTGQDKTADCGFTILY